MTFRRLAAAWITTGAVLGLVIGWCTYDEEA